MILAILTVLFVVFVALPICLAILEALFWGGLFSLAILFHLADKARVACRTILRRGPGANNQGRKT